ncbi:MAG: hypothetical protein JF597_01775 [Streptomyces sp.]|uniref:hypothetical protein n=1 Tax=Streptomyces sp. TaxID=1931 RepID=UPI0025CE0623|nr:hypothetical protein [Streptomyces sp.]MBW8792358.1 hypothetical protein [Streptomyces sp.]
MGDAGLGGGPFGVVGEVRDARLGDGLWGGADFGQAGETGHGNGEDGGEGLDGEDGEEGGEGAGGLDGDGLLERARQLLWRGEGEPASDVVWSEATVKLPSGGELTLGAKEHRGFVVIGLMTPEGGYVPDSKTIAAKISETSGEKTTQVAVRSLVNTLTQKCLLIQHDKGGPRYLSIDGRKEFRRLVGGLVARWSIGEAGSSIRASEDADLLRVVWNVRQRTGQLVRADDIHTSFHRATKYKRLTDLAKRGFLGRDDRQGYRYRLGHAGRLVLEPPVDAAAGPAGGNPGEAERALPGGAAGARAALPGLPDGAHEVLLAISSYFSDPANEGKLPQIEDIEKGTGYSGVKIERLLSELMAGEYEYVIREDRGHRYWVTEAGLVAIMLNAGVGGEVLGGPGLPAGELAVDGVSLGAGRGEAGGVEGGLLGGESLGVRATGELFGVVPDAGDARSGGGLLASADSGQADGTGRGDGLDSGEDGGEGVEGSGDGLLDRARRLLWGGEDVPARHVDWKDVEVVLPSADGEPAGPSGRPADRIYRLSPTEHQVFVVIGLLASVAVGGYVPTAKTIAEKIDIEKASNDEKFIAAAHAAVSRLANKELLKRVTFGVLIVSSDGRKVFRQLVRWLLGEPSSDEPDGSLDEPDGSLDESGSLIIKRDERDLVRAVWNVQQRTGQLVKAEEISTNLHEVTLRGRLASLAKRGFLGRDDRSRYRYRLGHAGRLVLEPPVDAAAGPAGGNPGEAQRALPGGAVGARAVLAELNDEQFMVLQAIWSYSSDHAEEGKLPQVAEIVEATGFKDKEVSRLLSKLMAGEYEYVIREDGGFRYWVAEAGLVALRLDAGAGGEVVGGLGLPVGELAVGGSSLGVGGGGWSSEGGEGVGAAGDELFDRARRLLWGGEGVQARHVVWESARVMLSSAGAAGESAGSSRRPADKTYGLGPTEHRVFVVLGLSTLEGGIVPSSKVIVDEMKKTSGQKTTQGVVATLVNRLGKKKLLERKSRGGYVLASDGREVLGRLVRDLVAKWSLSEVGSSSLEPAERDLLQIVWDTSQRTGRLVRAGDIGAIHHLEKRLIGLTARGLLGCDDREGPRYRLGDAGRLVLGAHVDAAAGPAGGRQGGAGRALSGGAAGARAVLPELNDEEFMVLQAIWSYSSDHAEEGKLPQVEEIVEKTGFLKERMPDILSGLLAREYEYVIREGQGFRFWVTEAGLLALDAGVGEVVEGLGLPVGGLAVDGSSFGVGGGGWDSGGGEAGGVEVGLLGGGSLGVGGGSFGGVPDAGDVRFEGWGGGFVPGGVGLPGGGPVGPVGEWFAVPGGSGRGGGEVVEVPREWMMWASEVYGEVSGVGLERDAGAWVGEWYWADVASVARAGMVADRGVQVGQRSGTGHVEAVRGVMQEQARVLAVERWNGAGAGGGGPADVRGYGGLAGPGSEFR